MAASPPLSPSIAAAKTLRVKDWIQQLSESDPTKEDALSLPLTPENHLLLKRKRATGSAPCIYAMSTRNPSPKRPRRDTDAEVLPIHSISAAGASSHASALMLNETNTFSLLSSQAGNRSPRRANSLTRDSIAILASASPATITGPSSGLERPPPRRVRDIMERLEDGLGGGWILGRLREPIEEDADFGY